MELRHLKYFVAVAEEENITRAAGRLHVAQPSLSRQIRDLQDELGVALFEHGPRSVRLTPAGRLFLDHARRLLAEVQGAIGAVRDFASGQEGVVHIGYAPSLTVDILPVALRAFHAACSKVKVRLHDLSTEEMLAGVRKGTLQAALLARPSTPALDGLIYREAFHFRMAVAMPIGAPLTRFKRVRPAQLAGVPMVAYSRGEYPEYHGMLERIFRDVEPCPRIVEEYDSSTSLIAAVEAGSGLAVVQEGFEGLAGRRLEMRLLSSTAAAFSFGVCWHRDDRSPFTQAFVDAVPLAERTKSSKGASG